MQNLNTPRIDAGNLLTSDDFERTHTQHFLAGRARRAFIHQGCTQQERLKPTVQAVREASDSRSPEPVHETQPPAGEAAGFMFEAAEPDDWLTRWTSPGRFWGAYVALIAAALLLNHFWPR